MTLDEAIQHEEDVAEKLEKEAGCIRSWGPADLEAKGAENCVACAAEHRQLAEWLRELKRLRRTGHWIDHGSFQECSECREEQYGVDNYRNYCAFCGAKMEGS